jgi:HD superfamily phosphohydrolase|tara:strand:+ start:238 stop:1506 length:1269 start_codon:yes stop_codon:yes gene_type:complete
LEINAAEIRDPVHGYVYANELERDIIDNPVFQRLRRIKQLACAHLTYPGAHHTRFEHSIGTMYLAGCSANHLLNNELIDNEQKQIIKLAALLHDIGHGPFSHLFEEVLNVRGLTHENISTKIIRETEINDILTKHGFDASNISDLSVGTSKHYPLFMNDLIGGFLSVDTMDYLLRDSYFSGVEYGKVDVHRIINCYDIENNQICIDKAGLYALESLIIARYEMFRAVYFHRTVRAAAIMIINSMILSDDELGFSQIDNLDSFLNLSDENVIENIINLKTSNSNLKYASELASNYKNRNMLKLIFEQIFTSETLGQSFIGNIYSKKKFRSDFISELSSKSNVPEEFIFVDVSSASSVPTKSTHDLLDEIIIVSKDSGEKNVETLQALELPIAKSILGHMDILRVYTVARYQDPVKNALNSLLR